MFNRFRTKPVTALAAVLGCALIATSTPAAAQGRGGKEAASETGEKAPSVSRGFSSAYNKMRGAMAKKDAAGLQKAIADGESSASTPDDKYFVAFFQLQHAVMTADQAAQTRLLDVLLENPSTPRADIANYGYHAGRTAYGASDYAKAVQRLETSRAAGSDEPSLSPLLMDSYLKLGQIDQGWAVAKAAIEADRAAGKTPSEELYVRPAQAFQGANRTNELFEPLIMRVQDYGTAENWRNTLTLLLRYSSSERDMVLDILRLMRATGSLTQRAELSEYAALAVEAGSPSEVVSVINQGKAKGLIPQKDAHFDQILESQEPQAASDAKMLVSDAAKPATRSNPRVARRTADALVGLGEYATAMSLYEVAINSGSEPLAQYRLGVAQALAGQNQAAIASLAKVSDDRQRLARLWAVHVASKAAPAAAPAAPATGS